jgi:hypothetical protein
MIPVMIPGKRKGMKSARSKIALPGKLNRSSAKAAGIPTTSAIAMLTAATMSEFFAASTIT